MISVIEFVESYTWSCARECSNSCQNGGLGGLFTWPRGSQLSQSRFRLQGDTDLPTCGIDTMYSTTTRSSECRVGTRGHPWIRGALYSLATGKGIVFNCTMFSECGARIAETVGVRLQQSHDQYAGMLSLRTSTLRRVICPEIEQHNPASSRLTN